MTTDDAKQIIDRDVKGGTAHLTGYLLTDGPPVIKIELDGDEIATGTPSPLPEVYAKKLPAQFEYIIDEVPLTADELEPYEKAAEVYEAERQERAERLANEHADEEVKLKRSAGRGYHLRGDLDDALRDYLSDYLEDAAKKLSLSSDGDPMAGGISATTTVGEIIEAAEETRANNQQRTEEYHDPRHDGNCGARYDKSAACECGAA